MARGNAFTAESLPQVRAQYVPNVLSKEVPMRIGLQGEQRRGLGLWIFDLTLCLGGSGPGSASGHGLAMSSGSPKCDCGRARIVPPKSDREHLSDVLLQDRSCSRTGSANLIHATHCYPKVTPPRSRKPRPGGDEGFC